MGGRLVMDELKWIKTKDRLPEKPGKYLASGKWPDRKREYWLCYFTKFGPVSGWCNDANNPVVDHWMPIPELSKEAE